jgi:ABC-type multidrug transport system ATPase subunit
MNVLELDNVELDFGSKNILKSIYLKAEKGKITSLLGSNGSGKTSLLRIIFGELIPNNKLIRIDNVPILKPLFKKGYIKHLPQFNIFPNTFSLKKGFSYFKISFKDFLKDFSNFNQLKNSYFFELSGGERRVIETYIILKSDAEIVLLDEPFSHIAPLYIERIKELIVVEKKNKIIIITDHLFKEILEISDDIYLLKNGWIKLIKNQDDLILHKYTNSL